MCDVKKQSMPFYTMSICAIIKDEGLYLEEWIEFHLLQKVDHFYLYLNDCTDNTFEIATYYARIGLVTLVLWPGKPTKEKSIQLSAYDHFMRTYGHETEWVACIDCDEFLYSKMTHLQCVKNWMDKISAILINWTLYGSNGHEKHSPKLVIERFTKRNKEIDHHVKTILKPSRYISTGKNVHRFVVKGDTWISEDKVENDSPWMIPAKEDHLKLAHFHTKSREEYKKRCKRGRADWPIPKNFEENFIAHDRNEIEDTWLKDNFAEQIKENLRERPWRKAALSL